MAIPAILASITTSKERRKLTKKRRTVFRFVCITTLEGSMDVLRIEKWSCRFLYLETR